MSSEKENDNIFDLTKTAPVELQHEVVHQSTKISAVDQNALLKSYKELPKDKWAELKYSDHIRYLRNDGTFRKGGYFKSSFISTYGKNKDEKCVQLSASIQFNAPTWTICFKDINKIWINAVSLVSSTGTSSNDNSEERKKNTESIEYLTKSVSQLKVDMLKINNEQKRIINLIKKLHGIKSK